MEIMSLTFIIEDPCRRTYILYPVLMFNQWMLVHQSHHVVWNNFGEIRERSCPMITVSFSHLPEVSVHCFSVLKRYFRLLSVTWHGPNPHNFHTYVLSGFLQLQPKNFIRIYNTSVCFIFQCLQRSLQGRGHSSGWMAAAFIQLVLIILTWGSAIKLLKGEPQRTGRCREQFV